MTINAVQLRDDFIKEVQIRCTDSELRQIDILNNDEKDPYICHSHDFCDSNQAIIDALSIQGIEFDSSNRHQQDVLEMVWDNAKKMGFAKYCHFELIGVGNKELEDSNHPYWNEAINNNEYFMFYHYIPTIGVIRRDVDGSLVFKTDAGHQYGLLNVTEIAKIVYRN